MINLSKNASLLGMLFITLLGTSAQVNAEDLMSEHERSGAFKIPGPTPECDGFEDYMEDAGNFVVKGVTYLGENAINSTEGIGLLLAGKPDKLLDHVNGTFSDLGSAAADLTAYTPLSLASVLVDVLPDGAATDFLDSYVSFSKDLQRVVASGVVEGLNPIAAAETVVNDLDEIAGDLGKVLVNLDDPLSAGNEFLKLQQKWTGVGALTYMLTEDNPMDGLKKALGAIHRQVEIVTSYGPGPNGKVASALFDHVMEESKNAIDNINDLQEKKIAAVLVANFATSFKQSVSDPNYNPGKSVVRHPLYYANIAPIKAKWMGNDHNSGGNHDWGMFHPEVENNPGCISLGDYAYRKKSNGLKTLNAVCNVESGRNIWWKRPIDYKLLWGDNCSGSTHDRSVWQPVCPTGYVSVGFVAYGGSYKKPLPNRIACLKNDINLFSVIDGQSAQLEWLANDSGSGAKFDITLYNRKFLGMDIAHAVPREIGKANRQFVQDLKVAVEVPGTPPGPSQNSCVNFYAESNHSGATSTVCKPCNSINDNSCQLQDISGRNWQTKNKVSSFHCGDEIAGIMFYSTSRKQAGKFFACSESMTGSWWDNKANHAIPLKSYNGYVSKNENIRREVERKRREVAAEQQAEQDEEMKYRFANQCINQHEPAACHKYMKFLSIPSLANEKDGQIILIPSKTACDYGGKKDCQLFARVASQTCSNYGAACLTLAKYYTEGKKLKQNLDMALKLSVLACYHSKGEWGCAEEQALRDQIANKQKPFEPTPNATPENPQVLEQNKQACRDQNMNGCENVGLFYLNGSDVEPKDWPMAVDYFSTACSGGLESSCGSAVKMAGKVCYEGRSNLYCLSAGRFYAGGIPSYLNHDRALDFFEHACFSKKEGVYDGASVGGCKEGIKIIKQGLSKRVPVEHLLNWQSNMCRFGHADGCMQVGIAEEQVANQGSRDLTSSLDNYTRACQLGLSEGCDAMNRVSVLLQ